MSDTCARSMKHYRKLGFHVAKVEHWNKFGRGGKGIRQDMFGFGDIFAFDGQYEVICQTTTKGGLNEHINKISGIPAAEAWIRKASRRLEVHGWYKRGGRWHVEVRTIRIQSQILWCDTSPEAISERHTTPKFTRGIPNGLKDTGFESMAGLHLCQSIPEKSYRRKTKK